MTTGLVEARVRRPKDREGLVQQLLGENDGPFKTIRDVLLFAAAIGRARDRHEPLTATAEPIRYEIFRRTAHAEAFIDSLAVLAYPEDPLILAEERLSDRIEVFEQYAHGGLNEIQREINVGHRTVIDVLLDLVRGAALRPAEEQVLPTELEKFLAPPDWSS